MPELSGLTVKYNFRCWTFFIAFSCILSCLTLVPGIEDNGIIETFCENSNEESFLKLPTKTVCGNYKKDFSRPWKISRKLLWQEKLLDQICTNVGFEHKRKNLNFWSITLKKSMHNLLKKYDFLWERENRACLKISLQWLAIFLSTASTLPVRVLLRLFYPP